VPELLVRLSIDRLIWIFNHSPRLTSCSIWTEWGVGLRVAALLADDDSTLPQSAR
jgi:hypothetical protein